jgi:hypothetical protein
MTRNENLRMTADRQGICSGISPTPMRSRAASTYSCAASSIILCQGRIVTLNMKAADYKHFPRWYRDTCDAVVRRWRLVQAVLEGNFYNEWRAQRAQALIGRVVDHCIWTGAFEQLSLAYGRTIGTGDAVE